MGSALGPVLANIILMEFEETIVSNLINSGTIKFYCWYITDTLALIKPSNISTVLDKFNSFNKNLQFTVDTFSDGVIHFLDILISVENTNVYHKSTYTGQYTNFMSFEPFSHKTAWIKSLFHHTFMICNNSRLFENQITKLEAFMSWDGFPCAIKSLLIAKLRDKHSSQ